MVCIRVNSAPNLLEAPTGGLLNSAARPAATPRIVTQRTIGSFDDLPLPVATQVSYLRAGACSTLDRLREETHTQTSAWLVNRVSIFRRTWRWATDHQLRSDFYTDIRQLTPIPQTIAPVESW
jgi:hypothetical protein